jgi:hypothetical protein
LVQSPTTASSGPCSSAAVSRREARLGYSRDDRPRHRVRFQSASIIERSISILMDQKIQRSKRPRIEVGEHFASLSKRRPVSRKRSDQAHRYRSEVTKRRGGVVRPQPSSNRIPPHRSHQRSHQSASIIKRSISILMDQKSKDPNDQKIEARVVKATSGI